MKTTRVGMGLGLVGLLGVAACESQVGDGYEGEVQFSLEGTVHGADSGLRPRIGFVTETEVIFVDGTVTGSFPSKFRFDVTEPAPTEAMAVGQLSRAPSATTVSYAGKLAVGFIAMMPEDAPDRLPVLETTATDSGCGFQDGPCVWHETACSPTGSCRDRTLECEECDLVGQKGDPALKEYAGSSTTVWTTSGGYSTGITSYCDAETSCYHEYTQCDLTSLSVLETTALSGAERCSILEESGDATLVDPLALPTSASQFYVAFATERITTPFGVLEQGYNLLEFDVPTLAQMQEAPMYCEVESDTDVFCYPELPSPRIVDSSDVSINLGFPPM